MKKIWTDILVFALTLALGWLLVSDAGWLFGAKNVSSFAAMQEIDKYEIRSRLLMMATDAVGACGPEQAARVWAEGLKGRSGAEQYAVMTKELKDEYAKQLEQTSPNWVTGGSSPWVQQYEIVRNGQMGKDSRSYTIVFSLMTSAGPAGDYTAWVDVAREEDYWRVSGVATDPGLDAYTGMLR